MENLIFRSFDGTEPKREKSAWPLKTKKISSGNDIFEGPIAFSCTDYANDVYRSPMYVDLSRHPNSLFSHRFLSENYPPLASNFKQVGSGERGSRRDVLKGTLACLQSEKPHKNPSFYLLALGAFNKPVPLVKFKFSPYLLTFVI